jgi:hypothetical protein
MMSVMRMRTAAMVGGWALAVAGATAAGGAGVSLIGDEVSPSGPAALSQAEVHRRVQAAATIRASTPKATPAAATAPTPLTSVDQGGRSTSQSSDPGTASTGSTTGSTGTSSTAGTAGGPNPPASSQRRSYTLQGGVVVLACTGTQITANTSPRVGFTTKRESVDQGTGVTVEFQSAVTESKLVAHCSAGTPSATLEEHGPGGE